jgi:hypothetical protein
VTFDATLQWELHAHPPVLVCGIASSTKKQPCSWSIADLLNLAAVSNNAQQ